MEVVYERDPDVGNGYQAYRGRLQWDGGVEDFTGVHFERLIRLLNEKMPPEDTTLLFIRSDRQELQPYHLETELIHLIKTDPDTAIEKMAAADVRVVVGRPRSAATIRSCADTLAATVGARILCRLGSKGVECPGCGGWLPASVGAVFEVHCSSCCFTLMAMTVDEDWVSISVPDLLVTPLQRFFLPREWNGFRPWVERSKLEELYNEYLKHKEKFDADR